MCSQANYINSFFTTHGAGIISDAVGIVDSTGYATATCSTTQNNNNNQGGGDNKDNKDDKDNNSNKNKYVSATMGCNSGKFVYDTFQGKYCDGNNFLSIEDTMDTYNADMEEISCTKIWDYNVSLGSYNRNLGYGSLAETILAYSKACTMSQYPDVCPDPYNLLEKYDPTKATAVSESSVPLSQRLLTAFSWILFVAGLFLILLSVANLARKKRLVAREQKLQAQERKSRDAPPSYRQEALYDEGVEGQFQEDSFTARLSRAASTVSASARSLASIVKRTLTKQTMGDNYERDNDPVKVARADTPSTNGSGNNQAATTIASVNSSLSGGSSMAARVSTADLMAARDSVELSVTSPRGRAKGVLAEIV